MKQEDDGKVERNLSVKSDPRERMESFSAGRSHLPKETIMIKHEWQSDEDESK